MGVSSSSTTAQSARNGESNIVAMGQTSGDYSNDPYMETKQGKGGPDERSGTQLKP